MYLHVYGQFQIVYRNMLQKGLSFILQADIFLHMVWNRPKSVLFVGDISASLFYAKIW